MGTRVNIWPKSHRTVCKYVVAVGLLLCAASIIFAISAHRQAEQKKVEIYQAIQTAPEPEICALCGGSMKYHAPVIVNLATGETLEMQVYDPHPTLAGEVTEIQQTDIIRTFHCAGLAAVSDPTSKTCRVTLPEGGAALDPSLYCRSCREALAAAGTEGYVIADLYDLGKVRAYPVKSGAEYSIRVYDVTVSRDTRIAAWDVQVRGTQ